MQSNRTTNSKVTLVCAHCGKTYERWPSRANRYAADYCSATCYHASRPPSPSKVSLVCPRCGKTFQRWPSHAARHAINYCSPACAVSPINKLTLTCPTCGKDFESWPSQHSVFCSVSCGVRSRRVEDTLNWKGGRTITAGGYVQLAKTVTGSRQMYEHRWVMEQHIGRRLTKNEHVHHINGDRTDNRIENLVVLTPEVHALIHESSLIAGVKAARKREMRFAWARDYPCCVQCGTTERRHNAHGMCMRCYTKSRT